jgi:acid stress chaperone HdeA
VSLNQTTAYANELNSLHGFQILLSFGSSAKSDKQWRISMPTKIVSTSIISALLVVSVASFAAAETTKADLAKKKVDKITCEDFNGLNETFKPTVIAWAAGFHKGDKKPDKVAVDIDGIEKITPFVVTACKNEPKASFWGKIDAELKKVF